MTVFVSKLFLTACLTVGILMPAAACTGEGRDLADTQWTVVTIDGAAPVSGSYLSLNLWSDWTFTGWSGVNVFEGRWESGRGSRSRIRFLDISATDMGSSPELQQQEEAYTAGLNGVSSFSISKDVLRMKDSSSRERVTLCRLPEYEADPKRLARTEWELDSVNGNLLTDNTSMSLFFDEYGNARGQAGPIYYETDYHASGDSIRSAGNEASRVGRLDEPVGMAGEGMSVLAMASTYQLDANTLLVLSVKGDTASFRRYHSPYHDLPEAPPLHIGGSEASWAYMLEDMGQLCEYADLIVMGTGMGFVGLNKEAYGAHLHAWQSAFRVEALLKGDAGRDIVLSHPVYEAADGTYAADETDPPVKAGERWLLFLRAGNDSTYTENGPWGRYQIIDRKVYSMNRVIGDNNPYYVPNLDFDGEGLVPFISRVAGTLRSTILTFYEERRESPCPVFLFHSPGQSGTLIAKLSAGWTASHSITFVVKRVTSTDDYDELPMPPGLRVWMEPSQLDIDRFSQYRLTLHAEAAYDLPVGIYWLVVECRWGGSVIASRGVVVSIHPPIVETR